MVAFKSVLSQSRFLLEPKSFLRGLCPLKFLPRVSEHPLLPTSSLSRAEAPALLTLAVLAFPQMFTPGIMSVLYLDIIKQHVTNLSAEKSNILFGIPQYIKQYGCNNPQNLVKLYNHFFFVIKKFYSVMVLVC